MEIMVRIAHQLPHVIEQLANSLNIDLIIMYAKNNKGLLWNKEIYQKLYDVENNLLVAKERVKTHFEEVIIQVDDLHTALSMIEQATYLLESEEGAIHIIPDYSSSDEKSMLKKVRSIVNRFHRQNPWFTGKTIINQLQPKSAIRKYLNEMYHRGTGSTCVLVPYPSGEKRGSDKWLGNIAEELNLPVFLSKISRTKPSGTAYLINKIHTWGN